MMDSTNKGGPAPEPAVELRQPWLTPDYQRVRAGDAQNSPTPSQNPDDLFNFGS